MAKAEDVARVEYVLNNYDNMDVLKDKKGNVVYSKEFNGKEDTPAPLYIYSKKINGTYYAAVATAENERLRNRNDILEKRALYFKNQWYRSKPFTPRAEDIAKMARKLGKG